MQVQPTLIPKHLEKKKTGIQLWDGYISFSYSFSFITQDHVTFLMKKGCFLTQDSWLLE